MTLLSLLTLLLLGVFVVWFFWPNVSDPMTQESVKRTKGSDPDRVAEDLFEIWSRNKTS